MSFSTLREIEACPRRWALRSASYPDLWGEPGYPARIGLAALRGQVAHRALQALVKAFTVANCASIHDAMVVRVLQRMGGLSAVIDGCIDQIERQQHDNPRMLGHAELFEQVRLRRPEIRQQVQLLLNRVGLQPRAAIPRDRASAAPTQSSHLPLGCGSHPELELRAAGSGWKGRVDLLELTATECAITDFKTGRPSVDHEAQARVYSWLWRRDDRLNPLRRPITRLTVSYPGADVTIPPPTTADLTVLEHDLLARSQVALGFMQQSPPPARPTWENCRACSVRQLCSDYWQPSTQRSLSVQRSLDTATGRRRLIDAELDVDARRSSGLWKAKVRVADETVLASGGTIWLDLSEQRRLLEENLSRGCRVRIIDGYMPAASGEDPITTIKLTSASECFLVPD